MIPLRKAGLASALLRTAGAVFPFSARGLAFVVMAAVLLAAGLARDDLAALFWGASFLLYALYAILASHFSMVLLRGKRNAEPDFLTVILPQQGMSPGDLAEAHVSARLPRALAPGFVVHFSLPLSWQERSIESVTCRLDPGRTEHPIRFPAPWRGAYRCREATLEVRDVLGFTANRMGVPVDAALTVHPAVAHGQAWRILAEGEAPSATTTRRRRSEELLEVRKYYPGDDARRLNWKVFAHSRELFLRVGEETPPPESRILFVLDANENPLIPRQLRSAYLDALVDSCASAMESLLSDRTAVLFCRPARPGLPPVLAGDAGAAPGGPCGPVVGGHVVATAAARAPSTPRRCVFNPRGRPDLQRSWPRSATGDGAPASSSRSPPVPGLQPGLACGTCCSCVLSFPVTPVQQGFSGSERS